MRDLAEIVKRNDDHVRAEYRRAQEIGAFYYADDLHLANPDLKLYVPKEENA